jgi:hypothetical protein
MEKELPTMNASTLERVAASFASHLSLRLETVNREYPVADIPPEGTETLENNLSDGGPTPREYIPVFKELFYAYMMTQYVIVPDKS